jgi:hypothetical protein
MAERDLSELDLAAAFRAYLEDAPTDVWPTELAHEFAVDHPNGRTRFGRWGFRPAAAMAWVLLLVGLLLALVVASLAVGALRQDFARVTDEEASPALVPIGIEVLPSGPRGYTKVVALSRDEVWVLFAGEVWHFRDGGWTSEEIDAGRVVGPNEYVTLAPDGTVWAAGDGGVAYRRDGRWVVADAHAASTVAVDRDGTAWIAGTARDCDVWSLRPSGVNWTRTSAACPFDFGGGYVTSMAVDGLGTLWVGAQGFVVNGLANYADGRWDAIDARAGLPNDIGVQILGVSATGDTWIDFQVASTATHARARFDGAAWTVISGAGDMAVAVAPDGAKWASALARYAELGWEYPHPGVKPPLTPLAVAPDGTVFAVDGDENVVRLPSLSPLP